MTRVTPPSDIDLLRAAIAASGLSDRQFALRVLVRHPQTVHEWLHGHYRIPRVVSEWLRARGSEGIPKDV